MRPGSISDSSVFSHDQVDRAGAEPQLSVRPACHHPKRDDAESYDGLPILTPSGRLKATSGGTGRVRISFSFPGQHAVTRASKRTSIPVLLHRCRAEMSPTPKDMAWSEVFR